MIRTTVSIKNCIKSVKSDLKLGNHRVHEMSWKYFKVSNAESFSFVHFCHPKALINFQLKFVFFRKLYFKILIIFNKCSKFKKLHQLLRFIKQSSLALITKVFFNYKP